MKKNINKAVMAIILSVSLCGCGLGTAKEASSSSTAKADEAADFWSDVAVPQKQNEAKVQPEADSTTEACEEESADAYYFDGATGDAAPAPAAESFSFDNSLSAQQYKGTRQMGGAPGHGYDEFWGPAYPETDWNTEEYSHIDENGWKSTATSPLSTFAADVDTASYANLRRMIYNGERIPEDAVRIEEMINYFSYDYPEPRRGEPFSVTTELANCPWNSDTRLMLVGLKSKDVDMRERADSNLVFLLDVSGSMDSPDKLPLLQRSIRMLCEELSPRDRVSIVTYASGDTVVLEGVSGREKNRISNAIEDLFAGGGTNGSAGINTAYELAEKYYIKGGNNRIILATDGDLNIGITDEGSLARLAEEKAKDGVFLSVLGFGTGNLSVANMQALAEHGNGNYNYIDSIYEARKVLIDQMGGTLFTVAKDVKIQVDFNPEYIKGYRLIGYETRTMAAEDFADDTKDGGEIGAGHCVTALYEIAGKDSDQDIPGEAKSRYTETKTKTSIFDNTGEFLTVSIRYKEPEGSRSELLEYPVDSRSISKNMSDNMKWASGVAMVGMILRNSPYAKDCEMDDVIAEMGRINGVRSDLYREEFLDMFRYYG